MELDDKHIEVLESISSLNKANDIKPCKKDIVQATKLAFHTVDIRLKDLENAGFVTVKIVRRIAEIQLTEKGNKVISSSQISLDEYAKD
jgi:CTP-dependent riboflavin kinase